jgi:hypothetical protein
VISAGPVVQLIAVARQNANVLIAKMDYFKEPNHSASTARNLPADGLRQRSTHFDQEGSTQSRPRSIPNLLRFSRI